MVVCTTELGSTMNTDQDFTFSSVFAKEASDVMFVVINFNSRCTTAWGVPLNFTFPLPHQGGGGFIGSRISFQPVTRLNVNEQLWTARWISRGINVILPLCDYILDVLCTSICVMRDETKERAGWRTSERQNLSVCQLTAVWPFTIKMILFNFICRLTPYICYY